MRSRTTGRSGGPAGPSIRTADIERRNAEQRADVAAVLASASPARGTPRSTSSSPAATRWSPARGAIHRRSAADQRSGSSALFGPATVVSSTGFVFSNPLATAPALSTRRAGKGRSRLPDTHYRRARRWSNDSRLGGDRTLRRRRQHPEPPQRRPRHRVTTAANQVYSANFLRPATSRRPAHSSWTSCSGSE